jgi:hypothetical protein
LNYLAHALPFFDRPYYMAGTGVPDWLTVADRAVRLRRRHVEPFLADDDPIVASVAAGVAQHLRDDERFHGTRAFVESQLSLTVLVRDSLGQDAGFRPGFLGHLLVEVLLDAALAAEDTGRLTAYYDAIERVDAAAVEIAVNRMAPRPTERLAPLIDAFRQHRILWDYLDDSRLFVRLNQVMRRVGLRELPDDFVQLLPDARRLVTARKGELLDGIPVA